MSIHLLAGAGSVALSASNANIGRLTDNYFTNTQDGYQHTKTHRVLAAYCRIPDGVGARINSPLLRIPTQPRLSLIDTAADPPNLPPVNEFEGNGPILAALDPFNVQASRGAVAAAVSQYGLWVTPDGYSPWKGQGCRTIRATTTLTGSTTAWVQSSLTLEQGLPVGKYAIVGAMGYGTNALFGRFIFPDSTPRPGFLCQQSVTEYSWNWFRNGRMGIWGVFDQQALPTIEFLHYGAGSDPTIEMDIVQIA